MLCSCTGVAYYRRFTGEGCIAEFATQYQSYIANRKFCIANCDAIPLNSCLVTRMRLSANQRKRTPWEDNIGGVTMEINSPNGQEIHWIREMLRQGMVVGRHSTATYIEVVVQ